MAGPSLSAQPRPVWRGVGLFGSASAPSANTYVVVPGTNVALPGSNTTPPSMIAVELEDLAIYNKTLLFELQIRLATSTNPPNIGVFYALFEVAGLSGASNTPSLTLGAEVAGSRTPTTQLTTGSTKYPLVQSPSFEILASGLYVLCMTTSGAPAATSGTYHACRLNTLAR